MVHRKIARDGRRARHRNSAVVGDSELDLVAKEKAGPKQERGAGAAPSVAAANSILWLKRRRDRKESDITGELARCGHAACGPVRRFDPGGTGGQHAPDALASFPFGVKSASNRSLIRGTERLHEGVDPDPFASL
jgi:hypothetical protein